MAKVLVIGSGAREHAVCVAFLKSSQVTAVYCAPGNPGMQRDGINCVNIAMLAFANLAQFAKTQAIHLTFVGSEEPLAAGIVDYFQTHQLTIFGPHKAAAQLESSKKFAKQFMQQQQIPTANYRAFNDEAQALSYAQDRSLPLVVKENGLAGGKGVTIVRASADLAAVIHEGLQHATEILIEDYLSGEEFSLMLLVGGTQMVLLPLSQDHKKLCAGDEGPNTGGMGAYSPLPQMTSTVYQQALAQIVQPTMAGLVAKKLTFAGVIYIGCVVTAEGPKVIEYNLRLGDPETQVILPQLRSDFYQLIMALIAGRTPQIEWQKSETYLGVVVAAPGYPHKPQVGLMLPPLPQNGYYANVTAKDGQLYNAGGRIFTLVVHGKNLASAQEKAYHQLEQLKLAKFYYRKDIGFKGLENI
ncbi:phosphoribosylamine--glycine ligase [Loigolactobacillus backii]|uniref:phosphoribosylamine--glycine ligase n=1 Tax=Loigolactobacillus backii TaxID=375175 RepID=UPI0007F0FE98|nr:phosphoribosylamine--glycine ligase [Loigolactobacillus backii]ANK60684.1 phosphoribosylamine--glycine ligase [Loigolactobacillus backii]ANK65637.1 phosphoribosylamine--glycine ligase [Loigolactobacillus backii]ANK68112.1 phosphoribosylamine--glycine ligase [Loigolactobacillus backii]OLF69649.1 phosphoribosylamine--glycine ligase [Loigolactobacillus backii]PIO86672.1 phosphoribosylamine--glycine ligase [Loigolactobacillus backii]